jgi:plastocyanin
MAWLTPSSLTVAAVAAFAVGCFSGAPTEPPDDFEIDCTTDAQPPAGSGRAVARIRNFAFEPVELTVATGTEVTWINCEGAGGAAHTATSDDGVWDSGLLVADMGRFTRTFDEPGRFPYHCTPHPFMQAAIVVE